MLNLVTYTAFGESCHEPDQFYVLGVFRAEDLQQALDKAYLDHGYVTSNRVKGRVIPGKRNRYEIFGSLEVVPIVENEYYQWGPRA